MYASSRNNIFNNVEANSNNVGILTYAIYEINTFNNLTANSNTEEAVLIFQGSNININNGTFKNCSGHAGCILVQSFIWESSYNIFNDIYIEPISAVGIGVFNSFAEEAIQHNLFKNIIINDTNSAYSVIVVNYGTDQMKNNTFLNVTYNQSKELVAGANTQLIRKWHYQAYVNYSIEIPANNVNVNIKC